MRRIHPNYSLLRTILLSGLVAVGPGWALDPLLPTSQYVLDRWGWARGDPEETITDLNQTPDGVLWIANADGLVRFDGSNAVRSPGPESDAMDRSLRRIAVDPHDALWGMTITDSLGRIPTEARHLPEGTPAQVVAVVNPAVRIPS